MKKILLSLIILSLSCILSAELYRWGTGPGDCDSIPLHNILGWDSLLNGWRPDTFNLLCGDSLCAGKIYAYYIVGGTCGLLGAIDISGTNLILRAGADSIYSLGSGWYTNLFDVRDSLYIPRWPLPPASGRVGLFGMDTSGAETVLIRGKSNNLIIYPTAGGKMTQTEIIDTLANGIGTKGGNYSGLFQGQINDILNTATNSFIAGGQSDTIKSNYSAIIAGQRNRLDGNAGNKSFIGAGENNLINYNGGNNTIIGGKNNWIKWGAYSSIIGGQDNTLNGDWNSIIAGVNNAIDNSSNYCSILNGEYNYISNNKNNGCIINGYYDTLGSATNAYQIIINSRRSKINAPAQLQTMIGSLNGIIRGNYEDSINYAFGNEPIIDSCFASFAFNEKVKKLDSTFAISKWIYTNSNSIAGKVVFAATSRVATYLPGLDNADIANATLRHASEDGATLTMITAYTKTDSLIVCSWKYVVISETWEAQAMTDTVSYIIVRK